MTFFQKHRLRRDTLCVSPSYVHIFFERLEITWKRVLFNLWNRVFEKYSQIWANLSVRVELSPLFSGKSRILKNRYWYLSITTGGR